MKCNYCNSVCVKNGRQKSGVQKFRCKNCKKYQQENYKYQARIKYKKDLIVPLIIHNCGFRAAAEVLNLSVTTIRKTILSEAEKRRPPSVLSGGVYEVDEMCAYKKVGEKEIWTCYAIEKKSKKVIGISVGRRKKSMIRKTINAVLENYPKKIYTDGWPGYKKMVPEYLHKNFSTLLSLIERQHMNARNYLKMLNRKTLAFVRSEVMLLACLKLLFWNP
jgi:IS1 family transposase/transposase-like protein